MKFAHIDTDGTVLDVQENDDLDSYKRRYTEEVIGIWTDRGHRFAQVNDDTEHGATAHSDGTFANPISPAPLPTPITLTKLEFIGLVQSAGGMGDAALVAAHNDDALASLWIKFDHAPEHIEKTHPLVVPGLDALAALGYVPNGAQSVLDGWPVA